MKPGRRDSTLTFTEDTVERAGDGSWCFINEAAAYYEATRCKWPVAQVISNSPTGLVLHRYAYDATYIPDGWTAEDWAFHVSEFYGNLPFRHGSPKAVHVVYDDPTDLRVIDLEFSRYHDGSPFAPPQAGPPYEEWDYSSERSIGWDSGYMLLDLMRAPDSIVDAYTDGYPLTFDHPIVVAAWELRDQ